MNTAKSPNDGYSKKLQWWLQQDALMLTTAKSPNDYYSKTPLMTTDQWWLKQEAKVMWLQLEELMFTIAKQLMMTTAVCPNAYYSKTP